MDPATTQAAAKAVEETARTAGKALDVVGKVFGDVPIDLVGVLGGAWLHEVHVRLRDKLRRRTEQILQERNVQQVIELSPNLAAALIGGAQEEAKEELAELWARLLANAMDPNLNNVSQSFIEAVKKMDPIDAHVVEFIFEGNFKSIARHSSQIHLFEEQKEHTAVDKMSEMLGYKSDSIELSLKNLETIGFVYNQGGWHNPHFHVGPKFRVFMQACFPENPRVTMNVE